MLILRFYPRALTLLAALGFALLVAGCVVPPSVQDVRPMPTSETPVVPLHASSPMPTQPDEESDPFLPMVAEAEPLVAEGGVAAVSPVSGGLPEAEATSDQDKGLQGIASYYAKRFNGRPTASGAIYDPDKLTAAHQSLPFGTQVRVVSLANGREVTVTVNDRCRKRTFPFIDLSRAAAQKLGFFGKGITKVRIIPLSSEGK